ncbi:MAG: hypothetical protein Q8P49_02330 [Candidatus Liptonbacteria bacterium]|nr:hypothetical protein [Candidatus Liptonbacteria bacterium]
MKCIFITAHRTVCTVFAVYVPLGTILFEQLEPARVLMSVIVRHCEHGFPTVMARTLYLDHARNIMFAGIFHCLPKSGCYHRPYNQVSKNTSEKKWWA